MSTLFGLKIFKFALKELRSQKRILIFLVLNLVLGIFGFFLLQIFQQSLSEQLSSKAQEILGADFSISSRRPISEKELADMEKDIAWTEKSVTHRFFAMASAEGRSRLVQVTGFDKKFPLYGDFELSQPQMDWKKLNSESAQKQPLIWIDKEIRSQFNLKDNSKIKLGQVEFTVAADILKDPSRTFQAGGLAPRAYIPESFLSATGLVQMGSTVGVTYLYKLKNPKDAAAIEKRLASEVKDVSIRFETAEQDAQSDNQVLRYFADYLGLVSLVALSLCFLCGGYLFRWIFLEQRKTLAIYKTLGLQESEIFRIHLVKNTILAFMAFIVSVALVFISLPLLQKFLATFNLPLVLGFSTKSLVLTGLLSLITPQVMAFPSNLEILKLNPRQLLTAELDNSKRDIYFWLWIVVSFLLFWGLSVMLSQSIRTGSYFTFGIVAIYIIFKFVLKAILFALEKIAGILSWSFRYAVLGLTRREQSTDLVFVTMSLSILILCLLPHIKTSIINEIRPQQSSQIPALFMFDIQMDQKDEIADFVKKETSQELSFSPMVRARILKLNDQDYERSAVGGTFSTREAEEEARFRNRGVNLSYKKDLGTSETVVKGKWNNEVFQALDENSLSEISLEEKYAKRIGATLGDVMTFDISGVELKARVTSMRQVRWTSFQPNFFILFQSGVLEESPQIYLTSISNLNDDQVQDLQNKIVEKFGNVSIIDVRQTAKTALGFIDQMSMALQAMAYLSLIVGLFVFVVLLNTQIRERLPEMNLLQIFGAETRTTFKIVIQQFLLLVVLSLLAGLALSLIAAFVLMSAIFNLPVTYDWNAMAQMLFLILPLSFLIIWLGLRPLKTATPNDLIRAG